MFSVDINSRKHSLLFKITNFVICFQKFNNYKGIFML